jgi:hypothetical protein
VGRGVTALVVRAVEGEADGDEVVGVLNEVSAADGVASLTERT